MKRSRLSKYALSGGVAVALLAGCGASQPPIAARGAIGTTPSFRHYQFFSYTGGKQSFKVPAEVTHLTITAYGANGGFGQLLCCSGFASNGGPGGMVTATIPVTPGERLAIFVGGSGGRGGFNGGAAWVGVGGGKADAGPGGGSCGCGAGGGASDVREGGARLADRVLVAGGGGGGGSDGYCCSTSGGGTTDGGSGGYGGARKGGSGDGGSDKLSGGGGGGGTQNAGGEGGKGGVVYGGSSCDGSDGSPAAGGAGGAGHDCGGFGGGGGGGYYGGGGGGAGGSDLNSSGSGPRGSGGGGGGGSSFAEPRATHVKMADGGNPTSHGNGSIIVFW